MNPVPLAVRFGLTRTEAFVLADMAVADVYNPTLHSRAKDPTVRNRRLMCNLRAKLAPHDIRIVNVRGFGYRIEPGDKQRLRLLAGGIG